MDQFPCSDRSESVRNRKYTKFLIDMVCPFFFNSDFLNFFRSEKKILENFDFFHRKKSRNKKLKHSFDVEFPQDSISDGFGTFWALLMAATSTYIILEFHFFFHLPIVTLLAILLLPPNPKR